ncbi:ABC transporter permease [Enterococcus nangangensis]|uniref:ABC transporter permease n=1 Tax=Enterococcus nangangensis TaxID=2559926 RepID=UPI0010F739FF|nr:ABC transporter permease [Enterococcus nangangensis]
MFLALKEIRDTKLKYGLLTGIILLIALVVFMLSGLAAGLSDGHKKAISDWDATGMVLNASANKIVNASSLAAKDLTKVSADKVAAVGFYAGSLVKDETSATKDNVSVFGADSTAFVTPKVTTGKNFQENYQITIAKNLATAEDLKVGDIVKIGNLAADLTVTGIFPTTTYSVEPVVYTNLATYQALKYGALPASDDEVTVNAFVFQADDWSKVLVTQSKEQTLEKISNQTFIENLPGYTAEKITLNLMIYVLIFIAAAVVGIFIYVLTLQKKSLFGVLKAQGVPMGTMGRAIVFQGFLLSAVATILALFLTAALSLAFPSSMPFSLDWGTWLFSGSLLVMVATFAGLCSLPMIYKIDAVTAIGG